MGSSVNDVFHGVMVVHGGGHVAQESSRENIICHGKSMGTKKELAFLW